jgi:hypothetical protein
VKFINILKKGSQNVAIDWFLNNEIKTGPLFSEFYILLNFKLFVLMREFLFHKMLVLLKKLLAEIQLHFIDTLNRIIVFLSLILMVEIFAAFIIIGSS